MYTLTVCTDLNQISRQSWNDLVTAANGSVFYTWSWLRAYELGAPHTSCAYHLLAYAGTRLVGILPVYLTRGCPRLESHRKHVVSHATSLQEPMLLAHTFYSYYGGPLTLRNDPAVLECLLDRLEHLAHELKMSTYGFINVPETNTSLLQALRERAYAVGYLSSTMYLPLHWNSFDAYLGSLKGKRRRMIQADERKAAMRGVTAKLVNSADRVGELVDLARGILHRHGHANLDLFPASYLSAIVRESGDTASILLVHAPDGQTICFFLMLEQNCCLTPWVAGIDYEALRAYEPYHFACRWVIAYAIAQGYREIDMGRGSYRFKQRYGFHRRQLYLALNTPSHELRPEVER